MSVIDGPCEDCQEKDRVIDRLSDQVSELQDQRGKLAYEVKRLVERAQSTLSEIERELS